nr:hypothetical protein FFPRI1PSEUD_13600 [Pseudomonas sp. FFPRI_1]
MASPAQKLPNERQGTAAAMPIETALFTNGDIKPATEENEKHDDWQTGRQIINQPGHPALP